MTSIITERSVGLMNLILRGEMAAIQSYRQAITLFSGSFSRVTLMECLDSHERRVERLRRWVESQGGSPPEHPGLWGLFAAWAEGGAAPGPFAALAALEEGERLGLAKLKRELLELDYEARQVAEQELLPEALRSLQLLQGLMRGL